jgi:Flp pilus assembly protein CpaB
VEVAPARRITRPTWFNLRTGLGLVLFAIAFASGQRVLAEARTTLPVWTAARDLPAYAELGAADLVPVGVRLPPALVARYATASVDLTGSVLVRPIGEGEMIPLAWLSEGARADAGRSMTIPVTQEQALGSALAVGDRLDVMVTLDAGDVRARTLALVSDVEVVEIVRTAGLVGGDSSVVGVRVAVTPEQAVQLAFGIRTGAIDIARVEGGPPPGPVESVTAEDLP